MSELIVTCGADIEPRNPPPWKAYLSKLIDEANDRAIDPLELIELKKLIHQWEVEQCP